MLQFECGLSAGHIFHACLLVESRSHARKTSANYSSDPYADLIIFLVSTNPIPAQFIQSNSPPHLLKLLLFLLWWALNGPDLLVIVGLALTLARSCSPATTVESIPPSSIYCNPPLARKLHILPSAAVAATTLHRNALAQWRLCSGEGMPKARQLDGFKIQCA